MRHKRPKFKLSRRPKHRKALLRNLVTSLIEHQRIKTTLGKARAVRPLAHKVMKMAIKSQNNKQQLMKLLAIVKSDIAMKKLLNDLVPRYQNAVGPIIKITPLGYREHDAAKVANIEFVYNSIQLQEMNDMEMFQEERGYPHFYDYSMKLYGEYLEHLEDEITKLSRQLKRNVEECQLQIEAGKMRPYHLKELKKETFDKIKWIERQQTLAQVQMKHMQSRGKKYYDTQDIQYSQILY